MGLTDEIKEYRKKGIKIGEDCNIYNSYLDIGHGYLIEIGNNCTLTNCVVLAHDASTKIPLKKSKVGRVVIGDNTFIGWGTIILPNVKIGKNCVIGAGSVVTKDIPDNSVAIGQPCKVIESTEDFVKRNKNYMKEKPVFDKKYDKKSEEDKNKERLALRDTFGYDE